MKKIFIAIIILLIAGYCLYSGYLIYRDYRLLHTETQRIVLAYNKSSLRDAGYILKTYENILSREKIPFEKVEVHTLMKLDVKKMLRNTPAIIFPDGLVQHMPEELTSWVKEYLAGSGNIAVIYDAGIKNPRGYYLGRAVFTDIVDIDYMTYCKYKQGTYTIGELQFASIEKADYFEIPAIIMDRNLSPYGKLRFPIARCEYTKSIPEMNIFAYVLTKEGKKYPAIVISKYGSSNVLYVNLPLGYLNAKTDNILLRHILRTFIIKHLNISKLSVNITSPQR